MFKSLVRRFSHRLLPLMICLTLLSGIGAASLAGTAHAGAATDPLVVVAEDQTASPCTVTDTRYVGTTTAVASSSTNSCLPGTVMTTITIPRSEAISQGQPFVIVPASNASPAVRQQFDWQVQALIEKQRNALRQHHLKFDLALTPLTCGWNWSRTVQTPENGDMIDAVLYTYETASCTSNNLQHTTIELVSAYNNPLWWLEFIDRDTCCFLPPEEWVNNSCPSVAPEYYLYNLSLNNENEDDGHDIEDKFTTGNCAGTDYYLDFGNL